ncbi:hypothetical protein RHSIM_Rhsim08G0092300 [Rhododendron simsii]|uniref:EngB-type G domain-containing protein n=1 Tax=Rhododendron simsii TaxID=118357 RepID=A0A834LDL8_RHOSS|nr:hypothetical protein RHSIM_Rhsim08G0092300 [Rhododendron simsii]
MLALRTRFIALSLSSSPSLKTPLFSLSFRTSISHSTPQSPNPRSSRHAASATKTSKPLSDAAKALRTFLFVPPGVEPEEVTDEMILPGSNIVVGPYAGDSKIKEVEFVKSSSRAKDCPRDTRPEFAMLGRSNVGKSSLINALCRKKEVALTSKKPGKTQLINHFLVNKDWYIVDLPGYGYDPKFMRVFVRDIVQSELVAPRKVVVTWNFCSVKLEHCMLLPGSGMIQPAKVCMWICHVLPHKVGTLRHVREVDVRTRFANAPEAARMDWSAFTKGYFLNRETLVAVLLLIDASVPPQKIDLDCANWLGRNNMSITFVFTKCDKMKGGKGKRPDENIRDFLEAMRQNYPEHPPWIMTSSSTGLGRDELLLHMSQLRNYWDV